MPTLTASNARQTSVLGMSFNSSYNVTAENSTVTVLNKAVAKNGVLTVRTDLNTGSLTMDSGHGILTGDRLDIFWLDPDGVTRKCQRAVTAGTVATNVVPIDLGVGDDLPLAASAVTVQVATFEDFVVTGNNVVGILISADYPAQVTFTTSVPAELHAVLTDGTEDGYAWLGTGDGVNPLAGDAVTRVYITNGSSVSVNEVRVVVLRN